jgi:K+-transporting ATPase ATPase C chain
VPVELITASASGLDPHVSPAAARFQIDRVAAARGVAPATVAPIVEAAVELPTLGVLGAPRVNVLAVNLALDRRLGPPRAVQ